MLLEEDLFEAVIGLAPNLFYGTGIPASILVLNRDKPEERRGKVLFIDASGEFEEGSNQNRLRDRDIERITGTFHAWTDVEKYARVVPLSEIEQNDWNLNISRYVDTSEEEERIDVAEAVRKLRELERERAAAEGDDEPVSGGAGVWRLTAETLRAETAGGDRATVGCEHPRFDSSGETADRSFGSSSARTATKRERHDYEQGTESLQRIR